MQITINIPDVLDVTSREVTVRLDMTKLVASTVETIVSHGATQKIADAASAAATDAWRGFTNDPKAVAAKNPKAIEWLNTPAGASAIKVSTRTMMEKARDALERNEWTVRTGEGAVDERTSVQRVIVRAAMKAHYGAKSPEWKTFEALSSSEQVAKIDANYSDEYAADVEDELARRVAARERTARLAKTVKFNI